MTTRILVDPNTAQGQAIAEVAAAIFEVKEKMNRLKGTVDSMIYGAPADYAALAAETGIPLAQGADFASLLASATTAMNAAILTEFAERLNQG